MSDLDERLERIALETLERHAFMFGEPTERPADDLELQASLDFHGGAQGRLTVRCSQGFAHEMASNLLGFDDDLAHDEELVTDVLLEFVNVLAGTILAELSRSGRAVTLRPPHLDGALAAPVENPTVHRRTMAVEEHAFELELELAAD